MRGYIWPEATDTAFVRLGPRSNPREPAAVLEAAIAAGPPWEPGSARSRCSRVGRAERSIGSGAADFRAAADGLRAWKPHAAFGAQVYPAGAPLEPGVTVVVVAPLGPITVTGACRVVRVIDEPRRFGFVYATLPGHLLKGTEEFVVEWLDDDTVRFTVEAVSEPAWLLTRLGLPVVREIQRRARAAFVEGMAANVAAAGHEEQR